MGIADPLSLANAARLLAEVPKTDTHDEQLTASGRAAVNYFARYFELPTSALLDLASISRLRAHVPGSTILPKSRYMAFLVQGCVIERSTDEQIVRLWREGAVFGDTDVIRATQNWRGDPSFQKPTYLTFLTAGATLVIPKEKIRTLAAIDPHAALMLASIGMYRAQTIEQLYTTTRKSPAARVAELLDYLAGDTTVLRAKTVENEDRQLVVKPMRNAIVSGPTQTDISEALSLGRATVERSIKQLRKEGALLAVPKGEKRSNKEYEIGDRELLREIARGG
ncbi:Crp/Fnr family transcriptional regulator [Streptomyces sp. NPDC001228]|uniref:Crp/Fnr family transcriptional regulator n=1 Tax=unclassified Streptomyces TaxID=2593676 RepID=UPI00331FE535